MKRGAVTIWTLICLPPPPTKKKLVDEIKWRGWNSRFCWLDAAGAGGGGREWLLRCGWLVGSCHLPFPCDGAWRAWCSRWRARLKSLRRRCCCCWPVGRRSAAGVACYTRTSLFNYLSFTRHRRKMQRAAQEFAAHNQNEFFLYQQSILSVCWDDSRLPLPAGPPPPTYKRVKRKKHSGNIRIYVSAFFFFFLN